MTTSTATQVERRDGYAEAIVALRRVREAAAQIVAAQAVFKEAMMVVSDAAAATGHCESWLEVLTTPYGDRGMPSPAALAFGSCANGIAELGVEELSADQVESEIDEVEQLIRAAIDESGPAPKWQAKLDALWAGGDDAS